MKIKDQLHNSATHGEAPNKDTDHVPFDISCNRLRLTVSLMEAYGGQGELTPEENNAIWQMVCGLDKAATNILALAERRDLQDRYTWTALGDVVD